MAEVSLSKQRYYGGIVALMAVVVIWVSSSFAMNSIFGDMKYNKPFLVTYLNTATFSFYLIPFALSRRCKKQGANRSFLQSSSIEPASGNKQALERPPHLTTIETIKLSLAFCILWFFANYTTNASLAYTSVGSSTILASMSGLFTLGIGAVFGVERVTWIKLVSVLVSFIGVVLVSYSDQKSTLPVEDPSAFSSALIGDLLALLGAIFYGCYTTLLKLRIGDEERINMPLFFGFVGAFNVILLWPAFPFLDWLGLESFELPHSPTLWVMVLLNAFIGTFLSDYLWLLAMLMTSPLVVTLGISLTIPLALFGDIVFKHIVPHAQYVAGALCVIVGFVTVNMAALREHDDAPMDEQQPLIPEPHQPAYNTLSSSSSN
ncbi:hypothetical protein BC940DRAFT_301338 [Gongronella butleri]|nr:hypothetical protein BC940DRAFT_301338 [Gongronella butleri]